MSEVAAPWMVTHGDALDVLPTLPTGSVDAVVTDPPYLIGAVSVGTENAKAGTWADMGNSARWFADWYTQALRVLKPTGSLWTFLNWRTLPTVIRAASLAGRPVASLVVWDKEWIGPAGPQSLRPAYEMIALIPNEEFRAVDRGEPDVWRCKWSSQKPSGHPAEKPVDLIERALRSCGLREGDRVVDPFMGSGSTGEACLRMGLSFHGIEIEEKWIDVSVARLTAAAAQGRLEFK